MPNARTVLTWPTIISQSMVSSAFGLVKGPVAGNPQKVLEGRLLLGEDMWEGGVTSRSKMCDKTKN